MADAAPAVIPAPKAGIRHFIDLADHPPAVLRTLLNDAHARKAARAGRPRGAPDDDAPLAGRTLAMIFEKNSTRTRVSFDMAMRQLGGGALMMSAGDTQLGRGETVEDTAQVLSRMVDGVMIRANRHDTLLRFASVADVPVINGLTDRSHPCQILADLMTFEERRGPGSLRGARFAWVGDGNNVLTSFAEAAVAFGFSLAVATPRMYAPDPGVIAAARAAGAVIETGDDAIAAAEGADCIVTDTWVSMGDTDVSERMQALGPYEVTPALMAAARRDALFMHCLPAHRGEEVSASVIDGPQSVVFDEAENRLHAQKAVLAWAMGAS
jgi:ornithine carbamoyltransferase